MHRPVLLTSVDYSLLVQQSLHCAALKPKVNLANLIEMTCCEKASLYEEQEK